LKFRQFETFLVMAFVALPAEIPVVDIVAPMTIEAAPTITGEFA